MERTWEILNIEVKTRVAIDRINLAEDLKIDSANINEAFCEQPAKFAYWATVAAQAKALVDRKKAEVDKLESYMKKTLVGELDAEVRREMEISGERITEAKVTNGIYAHEKYQEAQIQLDVLKDELLGLQEDLAVLDIGRDSMNQRKDMLISLGAQLRQESDNADLTMKTMKKKVASEVITKSRRRHIDD